MLLSLRSALACPIGEDLEQVTSSPGISVYFFHDHPAHVMGLPGVLNEGMYLELLALGLA